MSVAHQAKRAQKTPVGVDARAVRPVYRQALSNLSGLERDELPEYLIHPLRVACCELPLFKPASVEAIYKATLALPLEINRLTH